MGVYISGMEMPIDCCDCPMEELADWIELLLCPSNCPDEQMGEECAKTSCDGCWLIWLKSPMEVDNG